MYIVDDIMSRPTEESRKEKYNYCLKNLVLFATGSGTWDIFAKVQNSKCTLYAVAKPEHGGSNSYYGDCNHVRRLIRGGHWFNVLTDAGRDLMAAY